MPINYDLIEGPTDWSEIPTRVEAVAISTVKPEVAVITEVETSLVVASLNPNYWEPPTVEELQKWKEGNEMELKHSCFGR